MEWIDRSEGRYLDVLHMALLGLVSSPICKKRYELLPAGAKKFPKSIHPSSIDNYQELSQGKYIRSLSDVLLALDLCYDTNKPAHVKKYVIDQVTDVDKQIMNIVQYKDSCFLPTSQGIHLATCPFASEKWRKKLLVSLSTYGYFIHYLDLLSYLSAISTSRYVSILHCKNLIGPYDKVVKGGAPDFVQKTFISWGFFSGALSIKTNGVLSTYTNAMRLTYLGRYLGYFGQYASKSYRILSNLKKFIPVINIHTDSVIINLPSFIRFSGLTLWRADKQKSFSSSLLKVRIIYLLDKKYLSIDELNNDKLIKHLSSNIGTVDILEMLLNIEVMGMKYESSRFNSITEFTLSILLTKPDFISAINKTPTSAISPLPKYIAKYSSSLYINNVKLKSVRKFNKTLFETTLPSGKLIKNTINV